MCDTHWHSVVKAGFPVQYPCINFRTSISNAWRFTFWTSEPISFSSNSNILQFPTCEVIVWECHNNVWSNISWNTQFDLALTVRRDEIQGEDVYARLLLVVYQHFLMCFSTVPPLIALIVRCMHTLLSLYSVGCNIVRKPQAKRLLVYISWGIK